MPEANYTKPASQLDLEARHEEDYVPPSQINQAQDGEPSKNGYVGVDPIYQNHANDTEAPIAASDSVEQDLIDENFLADEVDYDTTATPDSAVDAEDEEEVESPTPGTPAAPSAPPASGGGNS